MWRDLREELTICLENAEARLKALSCQDRDFYAGKCNGLEEAISLGRGYLDG